MGAADYSQKVTTSAIIFLPATDALQKKSSMNFG